VYNRYLPWKNWPLLALAAAIVIVAFLFKC